MIESKRPIADELLHWRFWCLCTSMYHKLGRLSMYLEPYKSFNILWVSGKVVRQPKKKEASQLVPPSFQSLPVWQKPAEILPALQESYQELTGSKGHLSCWFWDYCPRKNFTLGVTHRTSIFRSVHRDDVSLLDYCALSPSSGHLANQAIGPNHLNLTAQALTFETLNN